MIGVRDALPEVDDSGGAGTPVVLLHCLGVDRRMWDGVRAALRPAWRTLTYDLPGHGRAPVPAAAYGMRELADQLAALLDARGVARAHVVGMSLGGCVAQEFAASHPQRVARLVLADTTPQYTPALKARWIERAAIARRDGVGPLVDDMLAIWFTPQFLAEGGPTVAWVRRALSSCDPEGYARACEALEALDLRESVSRIRASTLIALGEGDLPPFQDAARWMAGTIPRSELRLIPDARHAAPLEQSKAFADLLERFFASDAS